MWARESPAGEGGLEGAQRWVRRAAPGWGSRDTSGKQQKSLGGSGQGGRGQAGVGGVPRAKNILQGGNHLPLGAAAKQGDMRPPKTTFSLVGFDQNAFGGGVEVGIRLGHAERGGKGGTQRAGRPPEAALLKRGVGTDLMVAGAPGASWRTPMVGAPDIPDRLPCFPLPFPIASSCFSCWESRAFCLKSCLLSF